MKKIIYSAMAVAMLATTSCKDDFAESFVGEEATVEFSISTPEIGTRYGEGTTVNKLHYAVYDNGTLLTELTKNDVDFNGSAKLQLPLKTGKTYDLVFWADNANAPYVVDFSGQTMTINYTPTVSCNNEQLDAFYKHEKITVEGNRTLDVKLTRPFAQLNIAASDFEEARKANYIPNASSIKVYGAANTLNFLTGAVTGNVDVTFASTAIPTEDLTVNDITYDYLAMTYVLPADNKTVMDIDFTIVGNTHSETRTVGSVPFQSNYRTNIYGKLLTSQQEVNITIDPAFGGDKTVDALFQAAAFGGEVTLTEDVVLDAPLNVQANMVLNLNGKTLTAANAKGDGAVIEVAEGVSAKLVGGNIKSTKDNGDAAINNAGELVLENITIEGAPLADGGYSAYAVISSGKLTIGEGVNVIADRGCLKFSGAGETVINGGNFTNKDIGSRSLTSHVVDVEDGGTHKLTINGGTFKHLHATTSGGVVICNRTKGTVYVNGGNFSGGNYSGNNNLSDYGYGGTFVVTGGTYSAKPAAKYIAAGYKAIEKDGKYYVVPEEAAVAKSDAEISTAIQNGKTTIALTAGEYVIPAAAQGKTLTFVGTGNPEDVKIAVTKVGNGGENCDYGLDGSTVTFDGVTITTNSSTYIGYARCKGTYNNCVINGTYTLYGDSVFNNCEFNVSGDQYNVWTWGAKNTLFKNCTFKSDGKALLYYQEGTNVVNVKVDSCKFYDNGVLTDLKAAIEIGDAPYGATPTYNLTVSNTQVFGYEINNQGINTGTTLWANKNSMPTERLNVIVDGVDVY